MSFSEFMILYDSNYFLSFALPDSNLRGFYHTKALTQLILLKIKHGDDIHIEFMPILGEPFFFRRGLSKHKDCEFYRKKYMEQQPNVKILANNFLLDKIQITIVDPKLIKQLLQAPEKYKKLDIFLFNDLILGEGLAFTENQKWKDQRKVIGHQFTFENLKCRIPVIKDLTLKILEQKISSNKEIKLLEVFSQITGEVMTQTFFGKEFSQVQVNGLTLTDASVEIIGLQFEMTIRRVWTHLRGAFYGFKSDIPKFLLTSEEKEFLSKIKNYQTIVKAGIAKREEDFEENEKNHNQDFIQLYISETRKNNLKPSQEELYHQFTTLSFGGTDTTSQMLTMTCIVLSQIPTLQEQIRAHLREHVNLFSDLTHADLPKLVLFGALFSEVLRMYPPTPGLFRRTALQQHQIGNFTISPSYILDCGIHPIQQSSKYYTTPKDFNINRWLDNELKEPHAYIPFSSGPRNCIGQHMAIAEAKIVLSYILLTYKLIPDPQRNLEMTMTSLYVPVDDRQVLFQLL